MSSKYPSTKDDVHRGDSDADDEGEEEEDEEDESEMEEMEEWDEMTPLEELQEMEDGPSTYFVGGPFSKCQYLGEAVDVVQYREDVILVFPGTYKTARPLHPAAEAPSTPLPLVLDEAEVGGLRIYSVSYSRGTAGGYPTSVPYKEAMRPMSKIPRRVGPWFSFFTAATATAALAEREGFLGSAKESTAGHQKPSARIKAAVLANAVGRGVSSGVDTTVSVSSVYGSVITPTLSVPELCPVFEYPILLRYETKNLDAEGEVAADTEPRRLRNYIQEEEEEDEEEEGEDGDEAAAEQRQQQQRQQQDDEDDEEDQPTSPADHRAKRAVTLAGLCFSSGVVLDPLTRTHILHCVIGAPAPAAAPPPDRTVALRCGSLCEALVELCVIFGERNYAVYAYPRCAMYMRSCLIEGPSAAAVAATAAEAARQQRSTMSEATTASVVTQLVQRRARALLRGQNTINGRSGDGDGEQDDEMPIDMEEGTVPTFSAPTQTACDVGVFCDDADVMIEECAISNTRLGILLHDGCAGVRLRSIDIRSVAEVGMYLYGMSGAASIEYSSIRACGRECLLVVGPSAADVAAAEAALPPDHSEGSSSGDEDDSEDGEGVRKGRPVFAQHPNIRHLNVFGTVRISGEVRCGTMVDNILYVSKDKKAEAAATAETLLLAPVEASRAFPFGGVEGQSRPQRQEVA